MSTEATLQAIPTTRRESSSTAWLWWKETRQLAPLAALLAIVCLLILLINAAVGAIGGGIFKIEIPFEVTMLVFPGLFATGAGPLLVGQERSQRTIDWLALLPISATRLATTKIFVALVGLVFMWCFALLVVTTFHLSVPNVSQWRIGTRYNYSENPFSFPIWISHSLFVLIAGFYVSWRIKNQFYSLIALVPLAFAPMIATAITSELMNRPVLAGDMEWINFWYILLGMVIITPLQYFAAIKTLGPDTAPKVIPLLDIANGSPTQATSESIPPVFGTRITPIIWQSICSARGMLLIIVGMLGISFLAMMTLASGDLHRNVAHWVGGSLLVAPLAICWLGISVFKHDGSSAAVRFLADRGVAPWRIYLGLHAVPFAIVLATLSLYGLWNTTILHHESRSTFAEGLPTLVSVTFAAVLIYSISQWVSQMVRTLILSVILAPIFCIITFGWLAFAFAGLGLPAYALAICTVTPLLATAVMMRRYMDSRDRPLTLVTGGIVILVLVMLPLGFAASHVYSIPTMPESMRNRLTKEAAPIHPRNLHSIGLQMNGMDPGYYNERNTDQDPIRRFEKRLNKYSTDPQTIIKGLLSLPPNSNAFANIDSWGYQRWHSGFQKARVFWRDDPTPQRWNELADWIDASAVLLPRLRLSPWIENQEIADRLEVLLIDTLGKDIPEDHQQDDAVQSAIKAIGSPESRAQARRRALLASWHDDLQIDSDGYRRDHIQLHAGNFAPQGLVDFTTPRLREYAVLTYLDGIESSKSRSPDTSWRKTIHHLVQTGGVFESSRYGNAMSSRPAIETMQYGHTAGYGKLWGRDWEYITPESLFQSPTADE